MEIKTHEKIDKRLCGEPVKLEEGRAEVKLKTVPEMAADEKGLVHGGFVFGQADYAAMLAVNHPNVVLGAANVKFLKPVKVGDILLAKAQVVKEEGKKRIVDVVVERDGEAVFEGEFTCFVLPVHVLER
ncbi:Thioesterase superfamily [Desulfurobacterium pacificum]|uniref:Thioesterase superfamily n=1 Tax=Desulfurobacterium pacificum TaxID=240166 RepID=A0ABY1NNS5_9BACT|nr:PaaI family thioesterase [Desulfurobacterium pacificum]SMP14175.1 Thioesterase superfamily [Desulfurobacterium pacificum]